MQLHSLLKLDQNLSLLSGAAESVSIERLTSFEDLKPHTLCFVKNRKFAEIFKQKLEKYPELKPSTIIDQKYWNKLSQDEQSFFQDRTEGLILSSDVLLSMVILSRAFYEKKFSGLQNLVDGRQLGSTSIDPSVEISQGAFIGPEVVIEENVVIHSGVRILGRCFIGAGTVIYPNVVIYHHVKIGKNCRIHSQSSIGADGFGYHFDGKQHLKIWHMGGVEISDDVEIGACSAIDQGTFTPTLIGAGTKIDNHVQIGHNCQLGMGVIICGHVAIGGSSKLGNFVVFGGKSGMGDSMSLGDGCQVAGGALVNCDWPAGTVLGGHPARPLKEWMKGLATVRKLSLAREERS